MPPRPMVRLGAAAWLAAVFLGSGDCTVATAPPPEGAYPARIDSLRAEGSYAAALQVARQWAAQSGTSCEAAAQVFVLEEYLRLSEGARDTLAVADDLTLRRRRALRSYEYAEALDCSGRELGARASVLGWTHPETGRSLLALAEIYNSLGAYDRATAATRDALDLLGPVVKSNAAAVVEVHRRLGILEKDRARFQEAWAQFREAAAAAAACDCGNGPIRVELLLSEAILLRRETRHEEAETRARAAAAAARRFYGEASPEAAETSVWLALLLTGRERYEEAERMAEAARGVLHGAPGASAAVVRANLDILHNLHAWRGDFESAEVLAREALVLAERSRIGIAGGFGLIRESSAAQRTIAASLLARGKPEEAWPYVDASYGMISRAVAAGARAARSPAEAARLDAWIRAGNEEFSALEARGGDPSRPARLEGWVELAGLDAERTGLESELAMRAGGAPELDCLSRIQRTLTADAALVGWFRVDWGGLGASNVRGRLWGYVVRAQGPVHWVELGRWSNQEEAGRMQLPLVRLVRALARASVWSERVEVDPDLAEWAVESGTRFFEPLRPHLKGARRLVVCLGQMAQYAPLECWKNAAGQDLAEEFALSYTPSPSLLALLRPAGTPPPSPAAALLVGNPRVGRPAPAVPSDPLTAFLSGCAALPGPTVLDHATLRSALAGDRATLRELPALPFSEYEVRKIASCFPGSTMLLGAEASEATLDTLAIEDALGRFDVIHFATHALIDPDIPSRFALVLASSAPGDTSGDSGTPGADGLVTAGEMLDHWRIRARLITLSGCQTGSAVFFSRTGEPMGFLQGLLRAGANGIVLSRWKVDDLATALLMARFYENLAGGADAQHPAPDLDEALREARLWLRDRQDSEGNRPFAHPVYWAGFVLFGRAA